MQDACILHAVGWLRDLMNLAEPTLPSFGRLAEACLEHSEWPADAPVKPRSLATLFSKLDRNHDLDWLRDRPGVQLVLARVLRRPLGDVKAALGDSTEPLGGRMLRFRDVRFARELDLTREPLPPGIPVEAFSPPSWGRTFWIAPPGAGRTLVGLWLRARGLAHFAQVDAPEDLRDLPARGPLFLEVGRRVDLTPEHLSWLGTDLRPVCLAVENPPELADWTTLASPPVESYLSELIDYLAARLDDTGQFSPDRAELWMRQTALRHGVVRTFGDAWGLLGLLDEVAPRSLQGRSIDDLAEFFVARRVREATVDTSWGPRIADTAYPALRRLAARCLVTPGADLDAPRGLDDWTELLADSDESQPDEEWFVRALVGGSDLSRRELRRAARRLPPSGYQVARSLSLAELLVSPGGSLATGEEGVTVLRPRWLVSILDARAASDALDLSPISWGAALLDPARADALYAALSERVRRGHFDSIEQLVDLFDEASPELAAGLDASLRAVAEAILAARTVPDELVRDLLELCSENVVVAFGEIFPTLPLTTISAFRAAFTVLTRESGFPVRSLDPHRGSARALRAACAQACVTQALSSGSLAYLRIADELTPRGAPERPDLLLLSDFFCAARPNDWEEPSAAGATLDLALRLAFSVSAERTAARFWDRFATAPCDSLALSPEVLRDLWRKCPASVIHGRVQAGRDVAWPELLPHQFSALLELGPLPEQAALFCPIAAATYAFESAEHLPFSDGAFRSLFARAPQDFARHVLIKIRSWPIDRIRELLHLLPQQGYPALVAILPETPELLMWPEDRLDCVIELLATAVSRRVAGYELCFARQNELKLALRPLRR